jgi:UDP-GlcNAc3NAcA epimerase
MKVLSIVGARPQFIKAAAVSRALRVAHEEVLVHTGQHYDDAMSEVFFRELGIPAPDVNLGVGSGSHAEQTAQMLVPLERIVVDERPDVVLVYGDTNTTLAGGLVAAKLNVPLAHVEAGLRSFERTMPEEVNRVVVDHLSSVLLCPTPAAVENLAREGIARGVELVGDVMLDTARRFAEAWPAEPVLAALGVEAGGYYLATVHRAANADSPERLAAIVGAFGGLDRPVVWPVHPRTAKNLEAFGLAGPMAEAGNIRMVAPLSYRETSALLRSAAALLTDSGGMQKEAYFFSVPCVTLREETEWVETVGSGWNRLVGTDAKAIADAVERFERPLEHPDLYGDGRAAERVVAALERHVRC